MKEGVEPGARGGGLVGVVDEGERKSVLTLEEDGGRDAVGPEFSRCRMW